jgi:predicted acyl esterase
MLAARFWLPDDAEQSPVPAILEHLPYRKRDGTYERDALTHAYLARELGHLTVSTSVWAVIIAGSDDQIEQNASMLPWR